MRPFVAIICFVATGCFVLPERHPTDRTGDARGAGDGASSDAPGDAAGTIGLHANIVFVTAATFLIPGAPTSTYDAATTLAAADNLCQQSAFHAPMTSPVRGHYYIAWMSSIDSTARDRVSATMARAWKRVDDMPLAATLTDLTSGSLLNPIVFDENGQDVGTVNVMTGTAADGYNDSGQDASCSQGRIATGRAHATDFHWSTGQYVLCGDASSHVYCVGDDVKDGSL
jgi:hypothetical protein